MLKHIKWDYNKRKEKKTKLQTWCTDGNLDIFSVVSLIEKVIGRNLDTQG